MKSIDDNNEASRILQLKIVQIAKDVKYLVNDRYICILTEDISNSFRWRHLDSAQDTVLCSIDVVLLDTFRQKLEAQGRIFLYQHNDIPAFKYQSQLMIVDNKTSIEIHTFEEA